MTKLANESSAASGSGHGPIIKSKTGYVVSDAMNRTISVRVDTITTHPLYKKRVRKSKKFMVHDENNEARTGDFVRIVEGRPRSKTKSWELSSIIRSGTMTSAGASADEADVEKLSNQASEE